MTTIKVDGVEYNSEDLNDEAKATVASLQFVRNELQRLEAQRAVFQTAENGYIQALNQQLNS